MKKKELKEKIWRLKDERNKIYNDLYKIILAPNKKDTLKLIAEYESKEFKFI